LLGYDTVLVKRFGVTKKSKERLKGRDFFVTTGKIVVTVQPSSMIFFRTFGLSLAFITYILTDFKPFLYYKLEIETKVCRLF